MEIGILHVYIYNNNSSDFSPLGMSIYLGDFDIFKLLVEAGAPVNELDGKGQDGTGQGSQSSFSYILNSKHLYITQLPKELLTTTTSLLNPDGPKI